MQFFLLIDNQQKPQLCVKGRDFQPEPLGRPSQWLTRGHLGVPMSSAVLPLPLVG